MYGKTHLWRSLEFSLLVVKQDQILSSITPQIFKESFQNKDLPLNINNPFLNIRHSKATLLNCYLFSHHFKAKNSTALYINSKLPNSLTAPSSTEPQFTWVSYCTHFFSFRIFIVSFTEFMFLTCFVSFPTISSILLQLFRDLFCTTQELYVKCTMKMHFSKNITLSYDSHSVWSWYPHSHQQHQIHTSSLMIFACISKHL